MIPDADENPSSVKARRPALRSRRGASNTPGDTAPPGSTATRGRRTASRTPRQAELTPISGFGSPVPAKSPQEEEEEPRSGSGRKSGRGRSASRGKAAPGPAPPKRD